MDSQVNPRILVSLGVSQADCQQMFDALDKDTERVWAGEPQEWLDTTRENVCAKLC